MAKVIHNYNMSDVLSSIVYRGKYYECLPRGYSIVVSDDVAKFWLSVHNFLHVDSEVKARVCHNNKTIEISMNDRQDHLNHGDKEGTCS